MSRTLSTIYNESVQARNKFLNLTEANNDSKMSILNAMTWVTSAAIYSFETLMDAFTVDIAAALNARINGTPLYYASAIKKWQWGDELVVDEENVTFHYPTVDETKRLITHVSYQEVYTKEFRDNVLILKVAKGSDGSLSKLTEEQLLAAQAYIDQIKFAGVKCNVVSREGDVLVPKLTVYYDGAVTADELYSSLEDVLLKFVTDMSFDSALYVQKVVDAIKSVEHVTDVFVDPEAPSPQGIFIASYDDDGKLGPLTKVERKSFISSGYIKESTKQDQEAELPTFREALVLKIEK